MGLAAPTLLQHCRVLEQDRVSAQDKTDHSGLGLETRTDDKRDPWVISREFP